MIHNTTTCGAFIGFPEPPVTAIYCTNPSIRKPCRTIKAEIYDVLAATDVIQIEKGC